MERNRTPAERQIEEAMERGEFDNLAGKGKPLNLSADPLLDPITAIVQRMLRDSGVSHPLIEARKAIENETEAARAQLKQAWSVFRSTGNAESWEEALQVFRSGIKQINREIRLFNLKAPSPVLHGLVLDAEQEIARLQQG